MCHVTKTISKNRSYWEEKFVCVCVLVEYSVFYIFDK